MRLRRSRLRPAFDRFPLPTAQRLRQGWEIHPRAAQGSFGAYATKTGASSCAIHGASCWRGKSISKVAARTI